MFKISFNTMIQTRAKKKSVSHSSLSEHVLKPLYNLERQAEAVPVHIGFGSTQLWGSEMNTWCHLVVGSELYLQEKEKKKEPQRWQKFTRLWDCQSCLEAEAQPWLILFEEQTSKIGLNLDDSKWAGGHFDDTTPSHDVTSSSSSSSCPRLVFKYHTHTFAVWEVKIKFQIVASFPDQTPSLLPSAPIKPQPGEVPLRPLSLSTPSPVPVWSGQRLLCQELVAGAWWEL